MHKIKVFIKDPGKKLRSVSISKTLENLHNCIILNKAFVGTLIFAGVKDNDFDDVPVKYQDMKTLFPQLFESRDE